MLLFTPLLLFLLGIPTVDSVSHSLQYFFTVSSGIKGFPEFVVVGIVDGQDFTYYDSNIRKDTPRQEWIKQNEGPEYWKRNTQIYISEEQMFKGSIENVKGYFNQTGGVHLVQNMYGCEWDDETNKVKGFDQFGYDGEDYIVFDLEEERWIAPVPQAVFSKQKLDNDKGYIVQQKHYLTHICPDWVKKYVKFGEKSLKRKDLPSVSLLQKTSSSPVTCHATGFYPDRADLFWQKDEEELHEEVMRGEILPNQDGSFQMSVDLDLTGVKGQDWRRYSCVFHLAGAEEDIVTQLDKDLVLSNRKRSDEGSSTAALVGGLVAALLILLLTGCIVGIVIWKKKTDGSKQGNTSENSSSSGDPAATKGSSEEQHMLPTTA